MRIRREQNIRHLSLPLAILFLFITSANAHASEAAYEQHIAKGIANIEAGRYTGAAEEFMVALKEKPGDYAATLYLGIAFSRSGDKEAETTLKKALSMNPEDPRVNLELGIYYYGRAVYDEADDYFENTVKLAPGTEFSLKAEGYLSRIKAGAKRLTLMVLGGLQYDSNVILNPTDSPLPEGISGESDWKAVLQLNGRYNITSGGKGEASIGYTLYQSLHEKLSDYNITQHLIELKAGYSLSSAINLNVSYTFEHINVGGRGYDDAHSITPSIIISEGGNFYTAIEYRYRDSHFKDSVFFEGNSERTGTNNMIGITQNIPLSAIVTARAGYAHDEDSTRKDYWDYRGEKALAGLRFSIFGNVLTNLYGEYYNKKYKGTDPSSGERREDKTYTATISATKPLSERYGITVGQLYMRNKSNITSYDYSRAITSVFLTARF